MNYIIIIYYTVNDNFLLVNLVETACMILKMFQRVLYSHCVSCTYLNLKFKAIFIKIKYD